jgi:hypothetical protein
MVNIGFIGFYIGPIYDLHRNENKFQKIIFGQNMFLPTNKKNFSKNVGIFFFIFGLEMLFG